MKTLALMISLGALVATSVAADAKNRWRQYGYDQNWGDEYVVYEDDDDGYWIEDEDNAERVYQLNKRKKRYLREIAQDNGEWWIEDDAREKLQQRKRKPVALAPKKKTTAKLAAAPKPVLKPKLQLASVEPKAEVTKKTSKPIIEKPKVALAPKAVESPKGKTIGCTAGAAVVVGYGFGDVKPKACSGKNYAYTANRGGKNYEIQLIAATGEITDVKKLN
jgi:hypothetical protein